MVKFGIPPERKSIGNSDKESETQATFPTTSTMKGPSSPSNVSKMVAIELLSEPQPEAKTEKCMPKYYLSPSHNCRANFDWCDDSLCKFCNRGRDYPSHQCLKAGEGHFKVSRVDILVCKR